jgi:DNA-binding phage protein
MRIPLTVQPPRGVSKSGNPTLAALQEILKPLGLRVSVALNVAA